MEIVVEPAEQAPEEVDGGTGRDAEPEETQQEEAPPPVKKRGRPPGSKNKPKIIEHVPEPVQIPTPEPIPQEIPDPPILEREPKPKRAPRQPRAPKHTPQDPITPARIPTSLDVAANMLNLLRIEQAERQQRKAEMYRSWVQ